MKHTALVLAWFIFAASLVLAAPALKDRKNEDRSRILGHWKQESISIHGRPPDSSTDAIFRFGKDGSCGLINSGHENGAQFTLDPSTTPRRMKWLHGTQPTEWLCLYELDGDTLKVAFVDRDTEAPTKIQPAPNLTIYYLKRQKE